MTLSPQKFVPALQRSGTVEALTNGDRIASIRPVSEYANERPEWVFPQFLTEGTVTLLTGDAGSGKSTFASHVADCVSQMRPVLMLDRENPAWIVNERLTRLGIVDGVNLKIWGGWCEDEPPGPSSPTIIAWVEKCNPKPLVVWDSLSAFNEGRDENDARATRAFMQGFRRLADIGGTVLALHHSGKGESTKDYRGSSDLKASIDAGFHLANFGEGRLERLRLRPWKCRWGVVSDLILTYADGEFSAGTEGGSATVTDLLNGLLQAHPNITTGEFEALAMAQGLGRDRARRFLKTGVDMGTIRSESGAGRKVLYACAGNDPLADNSRFSE